MSPFLYNAIQTFYKNFFKQIDFSIEVEGCQTGLFLI